MSSAQQAVLLAFGVVAGFCIGSLICVVIERLPLALDEPNEFGDLYDTRPWRDVLGGSSRCSGCGSPIKAYDKIPFVSWLFLRGRCRTCGDRIPGFHPVVELAVPVVGLLLGVALGWGWRLGPVLLLVPVGLAVSVIDLRTLIVPTRLVWPAFAASLVLSGIGALAAHQPRWLLGGLVGIALLAGPLFVIWFILPQGMGFGDVRLAVLLGWTVGFVAIDGAWVTALFVAVCTLALAAGFGIVFGVIGMIVAGRRAKIPFGPALVAASFVCIAFAAEILRGFAIT